MPARAWELACGGILVFLIPKIKTMNTHFWSGVSFTSLAVISFCAILFDKSTSFPGVTALPAVLATMALVASLTKNSLGFNKIFENKFFLRIGLLSFGLYLWHWPLFTILKINGLHHSVWNYLGLMLISYGMSEISLKFVENPVRFGDSFKSIKPRYVILAGLSFCYLVMNLSKTLPYVDSKKQTASNEFLAQMKEDHVFKKKCHDKLENLGLDLWTKNYGDEGAPHLFLWGNSHAAPFAGFFDDLAKHHKFKISYGSAGHYASFLHPEKLIFSGDFAEKSLQTHRKMFELIQKEKGEKIVVLSNRLLRHFKDAPEVTKESIDYTINLLIKEKVSSIIMTLPSVEFPLEPKICLMRKMDCTVDKKEVEASRKEVVEFLKEMERKYSQIYLIDPLPFLCPGSHCQLELNGFPINQDDDHMSVVAGRYLYGELKQMKSFQDILKNKAK